MTAYYNELDPFAAEWLRNLIKGGHIADGVVDTRSIIAVEAADLRDFDQCHFFAGIGGWSYALRLAGWPDDRPVWTGSCPCQPFSAAGKRGGTDDERHLWPHQFRLIAECRPDVWFGEQVASKDGLHWLDLVLTDLEAAGYAAGAVDLCAAGLGAPHIRQRLWIVGERVGDGFGSGLEGHAGHGDGTGRWPVEAGSTPETGELRGLADALPAGRPEGWTGAGNGSVAGSDSSDRMGHTRRERDELGRGFGDVGCASGQEQGEAQEWERCGDASTGAGPDSRPGPVNGQWRAADWLHCRDGKWRPVEPGTFPLAHGLPNRVGRLRGYGNAIVPQIGAEFVKAWMECEP